MAFFVETTEGASSHPQSWIFYIDLSFVDKQTALVGMVGRMLQATVKTDSLTKLKSSCKPSIK